MQASADIAPQTWTCARLGLQLLQSELGGDVAQRNRLEDQLLDSRCEPRWAGTLLSYLDYFGPDGRRRSIPCLRPDIAGPGVIEIASDARLARRAPNTTASARALACSTLRAWVRRAVLIPEPLHAGQVVSCRGDRRSQCHQRRSKTGCGA